MWRSMTGDGVVRHGGTQIAVFGATGATGVAFISQAIARGHAVRAFVRHGSVLSIADVPTIAGTFLDGESLRLALRGADAAVCVLGPRAPYTEAFCAPATRAILAAMSDVGVSRFLCVTGAMIGDLPATISAPMRWWARRFHASRPLVAADRANQEVAIRASAASWSIFKPPRLTSGPARTRVAVGPDIRVGLLSSVSRASLARVMLDALEHERFDRQAVYVASR